MNYNKIKKGACLSIIPMIAFFLGRDINRPFLCQMDFHRAKWELVENPDGQIWDNYKDSDILHIRWNYNKFSEAVKKRNPRGFEGKIYLPIFKKSRKRIDSL